MPEVEVSAGPIDYGDSGGEGRPIVFIGGLPHDEALWDGVIAELAPQFRCLTPVLPLGAQRKPLRRDADLSLVGLGRIVTEFLERLDLRDAVVCFNDWGGAQTMVSHGGTERVGAFVLVSCETDDNYPPGSPAGSPPSRASCRGGFGVMRFALSAPRSAAAALHLRADEQARRARRADAPLAAAAEAARDPPRHPHATSATSATAGARSAPRRAKLGSFERPVLVVWDEEGTMMPNAEGRRLADAFPDSTYVELPDCYTLIPIDQPVALADEIRNFARLTASCLTTGVRDGADIAKLSAWP